MPYAFSNFLVTGLCNSSVNSCFDTISLSIAPQQVFVPADYLSKNL